jgi:hypothetical protein
VVNPDLEARIVREIRLAPADTDLATPARDTPEPDPLLLQFRELQLQRP